MIMASSPSGKRQPTEDFEWDANATLTTTWTTTAASKPRGRRAVYGSRANRGPSKYASARSRRTQQQRALVREEGGIGPIGLGGDDPASNFAASDTTTAAGPGGLVELQRESSVNSAHSAMDSSASSSGAGSVFDQHHHQQARSDLMGKFPPVPPRRGSHSRSNSVSGAPTSVNNMGRPPVAQGPVSSSMHQRSSSLMSPMMGGGNILFGNSSASGRSPSLSALEGFDRENMHPNTSSMSMSQNNTPQKVFGTASSAPSSAAPSPVQEGSNDDESSSGRNPRGGRSKKKTKTGDTFDENPPRPMSSPHSSVASSTSFSSLSKMGDMAPTWVKRSLQDCVAKNFVSGGSGSATAGASPSIARPGPSVTRVRSFSSSTSSTHSGRHRKASASYGGVASSSASSHVDLSDLNPSNSASLGGTGVGVGVGAGAGVNVSSPTRSIAAGSTASSRKRGVCESPVLDGDDIVYSPGGSTGMLSSSTRSRARSRIFSPDSTKKLMADAARAMCGIVDEDFFRGTGCDVAGTSQHTSSSGAAGEGARHHHHHLHHHRRTIRKRDSSLFHDDSDEDTDEDDDHSNVSMVDASMETEASDTNAVISSSSSRLKKGNVDDEDDDDDPTARLFGASGAGNEGLGLDQVSPPPRTFRRSRSESFAESVFGSVDRSLASPEKKFKMDESPAASPAAAAAENNEKTNNDKSKSTDHIIAKDTVVAADDKENPLSDISSYEDLKYIIKALRKWTKGKHQASFGLAMGCTIVLPNTWTSARKAALMRWATTKLGFSLRSGGGSVAYLQTTAAKGTKVLKDLEAKLLRHKELTGHGTGVGGTGASKTLDAVEDAPPIFLISSSQVAVQSTIKDVPRSVAFPQVDKDLDADLLHDFDSFGLDENASSSKARVGRPSAVPHRAASAAGNRQTEQGTPLVRAVTLDPRQDQDHQQQPSSSTLPCFAPMSVSPKDASFEVSRQRAPRHSGEYSDDGGGLDIMQHMHGFSPDDNNGSGAGARPPRLFFPNRPPRSICRDSLMSPVEEATPAPASQVKMMSLFKATPTFEVIETPMPENGPGFWGSRPIPGKDWGASDKCDATILAVLLERHDKTFAESEYCGDSPLPMITSQTPFTQSTVKKPAAPLIPFMNPIISGTAASSADLGFDLEVDKKSPIQRLRPKSRLHLDDNNDSDEDDEDEEENGGDDFDADIGVMERRQTTFEARRRTTASGRPSRVYGGRSSSCRLSRQGSVGATALSALVLNELGPSPDKLEKRRKMSLAVRKRMSLCAAAYDVKQSRRYTTFAPTLSSPAAAAKTKRQTITRPGGTMLTLDDFDEEEEEDNEGDAHEVVLNDGNYLSSIFSFLTEEELLISASLVQMSWAEAATAAHASLMLVSVGCSTSFVEGGDGNSIGDDDDDDSDLDDDGDATSNDIVPASKSSSSSIAKSMERSWYFLNDKFPWATFLSEGAFKRVYRVWNSTVNAEEAVSVMDVDAIEDMGNKEIVGAELSVSVLLSSLVRRNVCPNFVVTRGVFTCPYEPPSSHWGCAENKNPKGNVYDPARMRGDVIPGTPGDEERGKFQYIRMELCRHGDIEEWLKKQPDQSIAANEGRMLLFQMAFALHTAADRYSLKHYDVKLLNFFLQSANENTVNEARHPYTVLRYGIGSHVFGLRMPTSRALLAKLADYGTANIRPETNGQPVTIGQFTTLENSPPDFLISGDAAKQGFGHDSFGLGLCMLHLFTGHAPYEEILEDVRCPVALKRKLKNIWENASSNGYDVIRSLILADVYEDEDGVVEGEPDEVLYDTLYRYLVLFGIPDKKSQFKEGARVWRAIISSLIGQAPKQTAAAPARRSTRRNARCNPINAPIAGPDAAQFEIDCSMYSILHGTDPRIAAGREKLTALDGGMDVLMSLVSFDPNKRATPLDVMNSSFMAPLREEPGVNMYGRSDLMHSYMSYYLTQQ